ncbi:hypothetical protein HU200_006498 [Digitaria exilis]|uniref:PAR1 protein n=1 Tax=Digitaria exilis TaxID=1010633 RepID=A0A835FSD5_9POAL|nr:hypothetical protein HU200_006498 [Digitaria exilis]CAB3483161.1 unnamed protein product [Digitaria exilis]
MASSLTAALAILVALALSLAAQSARGGHLACEELAPEVCAFAVSSGGMRCVLERTPEGAPKCQTSPVVAGGAAAGWVESDACVRACGVDRAALGLPFVASADRRSLRALCSSACQDGCPNVVDLHATLAAAEGMSLPALCEAQRTSGNRRMMMGGMSPLGAPVSPPVVADAPVAAAAPCEEW